MDFTALHVEKAARTNAHKNRVKTLTDTQPVDRFSLSHSKFTGTGSVPGSPDGRMASQELRMASAELLGLDSEVLASTFRKKTGGVYSHFFKDLTPG